MCGVTSGSKEKKAKDMTDIELLGGGAAFQLVNGQQQWHPRWEENIDSEVNVTFINAMADRIYQNELVSQISCEERHTKTSLGLQNCQQRGDRGQGL